MPLILPATEVPWLGQYSLREWHAQDGLPSEEVTRVHQDRSGYLWMATARGLTRFDGVYFENLAAEVQAAGASSNIRAIAETRELGLVVAPASGGVLAFKDGRFHPLEFARGKMVNSLFAEPDGTLWAGCEDRTVLRLHAGREESFILTVEDNNRFVAFFALDRTGRVWIAGGAYLGRYANGRLDSLHEEFGRSEFRVASGRDGNVWILTRERLFKFVDGQPQPVVDLPRLAGAHYLQSVLEDRNGTLWLGTRSQGLFAVAQGRCQAVPTSGEAIFSLCEDTEGNLWAGSSGGGLNRFRFRDFRLYDRAAGLIDNFTYTVSEDETGTIWLGNRDGGVARVRDDRVDVLAGGAAWPQTGVVSVVPDGRGRIWVTSGLGVCQINPAVNDAITTIAAIPVRPIIRVAFVAKNGDYWVGLDPDRVGRYRDGKFESFGPAEGFQGRQVRCLAEDAAGGILIGTSDGRLIRFDGGRFAPLHLNPANEPDAPVQAIYAEPGGPLWVGTSGGGLYALSGDRRWQITTAHGLVGSIITAILPDDYGYLWLGSSAGIFSLRRQELGDFLAGKVSRVHPIIVGRDDGVRQLTCIGQYAPSAWKGRDGRLWFATRQGVLNFDPGQAISDVASPPIIVAGVKCDDEKRPLDGPLELSANIRKLEFRLSVLCLSTPDRVQIKYRLDGFDSQWITAGADRIVTYPRLPPGPYRLRAISSLGNGIWNEIQPPLAFTVIPRWWQRLWFQLTVGASLAILMVFIGRKISHRRLRSRLERLERESAIERERARIARNIHDDLGASLTRISLLTQAVGRDTTAPENQRFHQIHETVRQITRSMDEIVWAVNPKNDHLDGLVSYLGSYAQNFLAVAKIRCRFDLPDHLPTTGLTSQTRHNLYLTLKEALNNIVKHSSADEVALAMRTTGGSFTMTIADNGRLSPPHVANGHALDALQGLRVRPGQGLANIAQRVAEMGGTWEFTPPAPDHGATVSITISLAPANPRAPTPALPSPLS